MTEALEVAWFPADEDSAARTAEVRRQAKRCLALEAIHDQIERLVGAPPTGRRGRGLSPGETDNFVEARRVAWCPPWRAALQQWVEAAGPARRTYSRASRRYASRRDICMPGRAREGWTLHIVMDVSGSMADELALVFGAIATFCESAGAETVHVVQCDTRVSRDEWISPAGLAKWEVSGLGGSDMTPAIVHLARDPEVRSVLVITDGDIGYPQEAPPFDVRWVLVHPSARRDFSPPYGQVLVLPEAHPASRP